MPIVSRALTKLANREDIGAGVKTWRAEGVDGRGARWVHGPFKATQAEAETIRDAAWPDDQLRDHDEDLCAQFVEDGQGDPDDFAQEDLTIPNKRRRMLRRFARAKGPERNNFLCRLAPWVAAKTVLQIENQGGFTTARATKIRDRAIRLRDVICPGLDDDNSDVIEEV